VLVNTLDEAAARLNISRRDLKAMIDARKIEALPCGFTRVIPASEVERLLAD
jgi:excisionase family DNA binding protein